MRKTVLSRYLANS